MRTLQWLSVAIPALAIAAFARFLLQRQEAATLQTEIALLQQENRGLAELRAQHARLIASKISDPELERLRSDRAALGRLRAEINKLEESADRKARAAREPVAEPVPALVLNLGIGEDGGILLDGIPADQNALRQLLSACARQSERVDIRLRVDPNETRMAVVKTTMESVSALGKELGLRMSLRFEKASAEVR
ncbi:MAG: hypothetical protein ACREH8_18730 [Opitutaceae bacterium]